MGDEADTVSRRRLLKSAAGASTFVLLGGSCRSASTSPTTQAGPNDAGVLVNDLHSQLNPTRVSSIAYPANARRLSEMLHSGHGSSLCGGRHAAGGQQFLSNAPLLDTRKLSRVLSIDRERGLIRVEAGIRWPALLDALHKQATDWAVHQKQGGADELSLGGAVSANAHGRCLSSRPIVQDIEALDVLDTDGNLLRCSRDENADRFRHVVGGYGMFGAIYSVTLRLVPRQKLIKRVHWVAAEEAIGLMEQAAANGALHGDFQYTVDETADDFMRAGILSLYGPCEPDAVVDERPAERRDAEFLAVATQAHLDKPRAWAGYRQAMLATDGRVNWSDSWQAANYVIDYHRHVEANQHGAGKGSEILSEIYVPRAELSAFLREAAEVIREREANLIYGTVRLIQQDDLTALAWAKQDCACVIFNFHSDLTPPAIAHAAETFRDLLDCAIARGGSYYLTYHRFARRDQVLACYPQLPAVLQAKARFDPRGLVQSDWFRYYRDLLL